MKEFLKQVPGFRTGTRWKKVVAGFAYFFFALAVLVTGLEGFLLCGGALLLGFSIYEIVNNKRNNKPLRIPAMLLVIGLIISISGASVSDTISQEDQELQLVAEENEELRLEINSLKEENEELESSKLNIEEKYDELVSKLEEEKRDEFEKNFTSAEVKKQVDVSTLEVHTHDGEDLKVKLLGVEKPEDYHPENYVNFYKDEINEFIEGKIVGETVYLEKDSSSQDESGGNARYVWLEIPQEDDINKTTIESKMFNGILLAKGYASSSDSGSHIKYEKDLSSIGSEAESREVGLWDGEKVAEFEREQERVKEEKAKEEQAKKEAEAKKKEEAKQKEAAAAQAKQKSQGNSSSSGSNQGTSNPAPSESSAENSAEVLVTPTGSKYHRRVCGNGNFSSATLEQAKARGLEPCKKCY